MLFGVSGAQKKRQDSSRWITGHVNVCSMRCLGAQNELDRGALPTATFTWKGDRHMMAHVKHFWINAFKLWRLFVHS